MCPEHPGGIVASGRDAQQHDGEKPSRYQLVFNAFQSTPGLEFLLLFISVTDRG